MAIATIVITNRNHAHCYANPIYNLVGRDGAVSLVQAMYAEGYSNTRIHELTHLSLPTVSKYCAMSAAVPTAPSPVTPRHRGRPRRNTVNTAARRNAAD